MLRWVRTDPCRVHSRLLLRTGGRKAGTWRQFPVLLLLLLLALVLIDRDGARGDR